MRLKFTKMHGCGNDYIYFDCFEQTAENPAALAVRLSDRHFGVGGDGIVLIGPSGKADAFMRMFNADGSEGKMCGNAIRCVAKHLWEKRGVRTSPITVETLSGVKSLVPELQGDTVVRVTVDMGAAELAPERIPVALGGERIVSRPVEVGGEVFSITCVSMGNPHCVLFHDPDQVLRVGPVFEKHPLFPEGVNTELIEVAGDHVLRMRVWERGSGETLACGTGACAAAVAAVENGLCQRDRDIRVRLLGGELTIRCTGGTVFMTGGCERVFEGTVDIGG